MAATNIVGIPLTLNQGYQTKRKATPAASVSTAGTTFAVGSSVLKDYNKFVIVMDNLGSTASGVFTARATTFMTGKGQGDYTVAYDSTFSVGSTSAVKYFGPFESARFLSTQGFRFNLKCSVAGDVSDIIRLEALLLPGANSTYGA